MRCFYCKSWVILFCCMNPFVLKGQEVPLEISPRVGFVLNQKAKTYFQIYPQYLGADQIRFFRRTSGVQDSVLVRLYENGQMVRSENITSKLFSGLQTYINTFETLSVAQTQRLVPRFTQRVVRKNTSYARRADISLKLVNGSWEKGELLQQSDQGVLLWKGNSAYDWRKPEKLKMYATESIQAISVLPDWDRATLYIWPLALGSTYLMMRDADRLHFGGARSVATLAGLAVLYRELRVRTKGVPVADASDIRQLLKYRASFGTNFPPEIDPQDMESCTHCEQVSNTMQMKARKMNLSTIHPTKGWFLVGANSVVLNKSTEHDVTALALVSGTYSTKVYPYAAMMAAVSGELRYENAQKVDIGIDGTWVPGRSKSTLNDHEGWMVGLNVYKSWYKIGQERGLLPVYVYRLGVGANYQQAESAFHVDPAQWEYWVDSFGLVRDQKIGIKRSVVTPAFHMEFGIRPDYLINSVIFVRYTYRPGAVSYDAFGLQRSQTGTNIVNVGEHKAQLAWHQLRFGVSMFIR